MCGIAGWYRRGGRPVEQRVVARQCDRLRQRGPDDAGYMVDRDFGFGMRRLSIIDVRGGHQPIVSPEAATRSSATARSSIIPSSAAKSAPTIRSAPAATSRRSSPHFFAGATTHGSARRACTRRRSGIARHGLCASFAIRLGIKPLFVSEQNGGLAFGSEITALREVPGFDFDVDERGIHDFFCFGHVLGPRSIFRQVRALPPGHLLRIGPTGRSRLKQFWAPRIRPIHGRAESQWVEETRETRLDTVSQHMIADVPVGAFLSGGVDSGAIAAAMTRATGQGVTVFTAGFPGFEDRRNGFGPPGGRAPRMQARGVADRAANGRRRAAGGTARIRRAFGGKLGDPAVVSLPTAAQHVKVVLCGEGGDELFLGYNRQRWAERMRRCAPFLRSAGGADMARPGRRPAGRKLNYLRDYAIRLPRWSPARQWLRAILRRRHDHAAVGTRTHLPARFLAEARCRDTLALRTEKRSATRRNPPRRSTSSCSAT